MAGITYLEFEKPIVELQERIATLREKTTEGDGHSDPEIQQLEQELANLRETVFSQLSRWQRIQLARHPQRPYSNDYIRMMTSDYLPLHGDRYYADDSALIGGFATLEDIPLMVIGQQKGRTTKEKLARNFGMIYLPRGT